MTPSQIKTLRALHAEGNGDRVIAERLGVTRHAVRREITNLLKEQASRKGSEIIIHQDDLFALPTAPLAVPEYAARITACMHKTVESYLMVGRLLAHAKANLDHGQFTDLVERELPFTSRTAQRFMAIAADARLSNPTHVSHLPGSWGTLYELTKLDDDSFQQRIADGTINPTMERRDIATTVKKQLRANRERVLGACQLALPSKKYGVIVSDNEWHDETWSEAGMDRHASNHYPTSVTAVLESRPVADIAAPDCVLWMWTTNQHLRIAIGVMEAWGFEYKSNYCWGKDAISLGRWQRGKHELLLIGTRGSPPCPAPGTQWESLQLAPKSKHSAKPECFLEMIEQYFPTLPKIELNRRGPARANWDAWGNESTSSEAA